jgi:IclR family pca regulon transcriptional regulator
MATEPSTPVLRSGATSKTKEIPGREFVGDPNFMSSLARGLSVLQAYSQLKRPASIAQLSSRTGLSRAVVRRCMYTLTQLGYAVCNEAPHFVLLPKVLGLGYAYLASMPIAQAAHPVLERLGEKLHESCSVSVLDGDEIIYIARASMTRIMSVDLHIGSRLPAFCTSMGRVLLANLPGPELETYLRRVKLARYTSYTITSISKLRQTLRTIRRNGYAVVDQELETGLRSIAVPIINPNGEVMAALNVGAHAQRVAVSDLQSEVLPHLRSSAEELGLLFIE